jgi:hypothetical protein
MNARLIKETRDLLPMFAGALLLIAVPYLIWGANAAEFGAVAFGLACAVLGGCSLGNEFQHRTLPLLLAQPISRSVLWRDKMLVLGAGIATSLTVLVICQRVYCPVPAREGPVVLALVALCAFCGAPYWTLVLRHGIAGMAFAFAAPASIPCLLLLANALLPQPFDDETVAQVSVIPVVIFCALVYRLGYAQFKRLEVFDSTARELSLPAGLEAVLARPLTKVSSRFRGPFASLLKKELRLQQISFLLAGLSVLIAVVGACLIKLHRDLAGGIVGCGFAIDIVILPLIAGAMSVGEEKDWGIAEWHLTFPPSALKQWSAKMLATLSTSLALGLLLPTAMFLAGQALLGQPGSSASLPPAPEILGWVLGQLLLTSVAVYAASFSNSTLRAVLAALGIIVASFGISFLTAKWGGEAIHRLGVLRQYLGHPIHQANLVLLVLYAVLMLMLCLTQWFGWSNFRRFGLPVGRLVIQFLVLFIAVPLISLAIVAALFLAPGGGG